VEMMMTDQAMATNATLSAKADAFLNKLSTPYRPMAEPKGKTVPAPKKLKLLSFEDYKQDIRARWLILQREINELIIDIKKFIDFATPMIKSTFDKLKSLFSKKKST
jgi:hypothetical protein